MTLIYYYEPFWNGRRSEAIQCQLAAKETNQRFDQVLHEISRGFDQAQRMGGSELKINATRPNKTCIPGRLCLITWLDRNYPS